MERNIAKNGILKGARLNNLISCNIMGGQILKRKCACGSLTVKRFCCEYLDGKQSTLRVRSSGSAFCRNSQSTKGKYHVEAEKNLLK